MRKAGRRSWIRDEKVKSIPAGRCPPVDRLARARARRSSGSPTLGAAARLRASVLASRARAAGRPSRSGRRGAEAELVARGAAAAAELARAPPALGWSTRRASCCTPTSAARRSRPVRRAQSQSRGRSYWRSRARPRARARAGTRGAAVAAQAAAALGRGGGARGQQQRRRGAARARSARARAIGDRLARRARRDRRLVPRAGDHGVRGRASWSRSARPIARTCADYERAIDAAIPRCCSRSTAAISRSGASSPRPTLRELAELALAARPSVRRGSGQRCAGRSLEAGLSRRRSGPPAACARGADVVCFSGDKLLGGPQAGIILARDAALSRSRCGAIPLARALRMDKLSLAALDWTLSAHLDGRAEQRDPCAAPAARAARRAARRAAALAERLRACEGFDAEAHIEADHSYAGGGSLPGLALERWVVAMRELRRVRSSSPLGCAGPTRR